MSFADERKAIESRFQQNWTGAPVKYENAPFPDTADAYVALFVLEGEGEQISLGDAPLRRWAGVIVVQVFVPERSRTNQALVYADSVRAIFERQEFASGASGLIRCRVTSVKKVGVRDGWYQVNASTPYIRDKAA